MNVIDVNNCKLFTTVRPGKWKIARRNRRGISQAQCAQNCASSRWIGESRERGNSWLANDRVRRWETIDSTRTRTTSKWQSRSFSLLPHAYSDARWICQRAYTLRCIAYIPERDQVAIAFDSALRSTAISIDKAHYWIANDNGLTRSFRGERDNGTAFFY